jgi:hypothetical protein
VTVPSKQIGSCAMPGLICPTEIIIEWTDEMNSVRRSTSVKHRTLDTLCFETTLIIYKQGSDNQTVNCEWN